MLCVGGQSRFPGCIPAASDKTLPLNPKTKGPGGAPLLARQADNWAEYEAVRD
jgi:hypothetical protein